MRYLCKSQHVHHANQHERIDTLKILFEYALQRPASSRSSGSAQAVPASWQFAHDRLPTAPARRFKVGTAVFEAAFTGKQCIYGMPWPPRVAAPVGRSRVHGMPWATNQDSGPTGAPETSRSFWHPLAPFGTFWYLLASIGMARVLLTSCTSCKFHE